MRVNRQSGWPQFNKCLRDRKITFRETFFTRWDRQNTSYCSEFEKMGEQKMTEGLSKRTAQYADY